MKKLVFTIATIAAFSFANAQEIKQTETTTPKKATATTDKKVQADAGATTDKNTNTSGTVAEPKKAGTRMAINEKGLPGEKKPEKSTKATTTSNPK